MYQTLFTQLMANFRKLQAENLSDNQRISLKQALHETLSAYTVKPREEQDLDKVSENQHLINAFISAKSVEGCSKKTLRYYHTTIDEAVRVIDKPIVQITTDDLRSYLAHFQVQRQVSGVTLDNVRRILSTFFIWLENEDYILKSPVKKIHKVRIMQTVKESLTDEEIEKIRETCHTKRDTAIVDMLLSTGMRVGELVLLDRDDLNFQERECTVLGKGNKQRTVYFDAKAKMHIQDYLNSRIDDNPALFVALKQPYSRMTISAIELRIKRIGQKAIGKRVYPHMFRRTLATMAIDKGMPIEQVQTLLGHVKIDTTLHYAMVNQENVKNSHRKFIE